MAFAVAFAVLGAFLFGTSAALQQHAARESDYAPAHPGEANAPKHVVVVVSLLRLIRGLFRRPLWLIGWCANLLGFGAQAAALHFGSVALVQPLLVTQLLFALPLSLSLRHRKPNWRDLASAALICGGLALFLSVRGVAPRADIANRGWAILAGLVVAVAVVLIIGAATGRRPELHSTLVAIAAGLCFAYSAVALSLTVDDLVHRGIAATATDWPGYALAASTLTGLLLEQGAFAAGSLPPAVAAMNITNPVASYLIGIFAFNVTLPQSATQLTALLIAAVLISAGAIGLAHSPSVRDDREEQYGAQAGRSHGPPRPQTSH
ncbi:DMT family transporter [Asanoa sp. WMMD1127]|uniref:DMT family transporter n=1 Tax=Asanoa sp. WMMD1127 TaxID=3016107 RepID=UPI00241694C0|nr:DMT family transporter [Asanoa sp. WMMD1127]MDG4827487.1 DMT family transporter [Asanoa sp. WMMD1127]